MDFVERSFHRHLILHRSSGFKSNHRFIVESYSCLIKCWRSFCLRAIFVVIPTASFVALELHLQGDLFVISVWYRKRFPTNKLNTVRSYHHDIALNLYSHYSGNLENNCTPDRPCKEQGRFFSTEKVNANPGLITNQSIDVFLYKIVFHCLFLYSLRLLKLKTQWQTI